jgi:hypothetical protein
VQGNGVYALHSHMCTLDFATEPSFNCGDDDAGDVTFVTATCSIGGSDAIEEYMAYRLFTLSAGFGLGEDENGDMLIL